MSELKRGLFRRKRSGDTEASVANGSSNGSDVKRDGEAASRPADQDLASQKTTRKRKRRRLMLGVLPTMLTLGNGVCGLAAIAIAVSTNETLPWDPDTKLFVAGVLIFGGMLFDALDGSAARMTGQESEFGAELDSLCDAVTFGTAPAVLIWQISQISPQKLTWAIGVLFTLCVLIRLARFNVETDEDDAHEGFEGLPSPAAAGTLAAMAIALPDLRAFAEDDTYHEYIRWLADVTFHGFHYFVPILALVLAFLMVSRFPYPHVFSQWVRNKQAPHRIGQALFLVVGIVLLHWVVLPLSFLFYAFTSPVRSGIRRLNKKIKPADSGDV